MIGFFVDSGFLDLLPSTSVNFEINTEIYTTGEPTLIEGSYSFPFTVPMTIHNRNLLRFPDIIDTLNPILGDADSTFYAGEGSSIGFPMYVGSLYVLSANEKTAELSFIVKGLAIKKELKFSDIDLGKYAIPGAGVLLNALAVHMTETTIHPLDYDHVFFPVLNPTLVREFNGLTGQLSGTGYEGRFMNAWYHVQQQWAFDFDTDPDRKKNAALVPFLRLKPLLHKVVEALGFTIEDKWLVEEEQELICTFNNTSISNLDSGWNNTINYNDHVPADIKLIDWLKTICKTNFVGIFLDPDRNTLSLIPYKYMIDQKHRHDWTHNQEYNPTVDQDNNVPRYISYAQDSSDEYFNNNYASINQLLVDSVVVNDYYEAGGNTFNLSDGFYYSYREDAIFEKKTVTTGYLTEGWKIFSQLFKGISIASGRGEEVKMGAIPLHARAYPRLSTSTGFGLITPVCEIPLNINVSIDDGVSKVKVRELRHALTSIRLMIYRGNRAFTDGGPGTWPYANSNAYDPANESETFDHSLLLTGEKGIYNKWAKEWVYFMANKKVVKTRLKLSIAQVANWKQYDKVRVGEMMYFVKSMKLQFSDNGMKPVEATLVSIPIT